MTTSRPAWGVIWEPFWKLVKDWAVLAAAALGYALDGLPGLFYGLAGMSLVYIANAYLGARKVEPRDD